MDQIALDPEMVDDIAMDPEMDDAIAMDPIITICSGLFLS